MEKPLQILIIDDDEVDRMSLERSLRRSGIDTEAHAADGMPAARVLLREQQFDCIFLDYLLPGGDGLQLLREIREMGIQVPVIVVTSQGDEKVAVEVMKSGGTDYMTKKLLNPDGVGQILRNALRTHRMEEERRQTAKALRESQARLADAQRIANIGSWEIPLRSGNRYWSEETYRILGFDEETQLPPSRQLFMRHIHPDDRKVTETAYHLCAREGTPFKLDIRVITAQGRERHVEVHGKGVKDNLGLVKTVVGTIQDITPRKEIEAALIEAREAAVASAHAKQEFLANMSHEIRTPMNAIIGFVRLLENSPLNPEQQEYLSAINTGSEALMAILNDILDLSKIEAGKLSFEQSELSLNRLLRSVEQIFRAKASDQGLELHLHKGPGVPDTVIGDYARLNQVLINLVGNAIKFTDQGHVAIEIKLLEKGNGKVKLLFEVSDTGIGIPREKVDMIFESFAQASSDTTRKYGGTGLGLTICKRIVELQGGSLGVSSDLGEGSNFYFDLEFGMMETGASASQGPAPEQQVPVLQQPLTVLLVEDNLLNQRLASKMLENLGHQYDLAVNGAEAVKQVQTRPYDVVLMDIQMPVMDGLEASRSIRGLGTPASRVPIIALTAHALAEEKERCLQAGMDGFLSKPFKAEELTAAMAAVVGAGAAQAEPEAEAAQGDYLSLDAVDALADGNDPFRKEMMDIFLEETPRALDRIQTALQAEDWKSLYLSAHTIKPSFLLFQVRGAAELFAGIEAALKADPKQETLAPLVGDLADMTQLSCELLTQLREAP